MIFVSVAGSEKGNKMILIVIVVVGLVIVSVFGFLCWKWVVKRRGDLFDL